jgi:hypothetical protein
MNEGQRGFSFLPPPLRERDTLDEAPALVLSLTSDYYTTIEYDYGCTRTINGHCPLHPTSITRTMDQTTTFITLLFLDEQSTKEEEAGACYSCRISQ